MTQIICEDLTIGYSGEPLIEHLNFTVSAGDYLCIVGANGAGKSTLMKTLLHLNAPLKGKIRLGEGLKPQEIGYLPQQTEVQRDFPASVREIVLSGCQGQMGWRPFYNAREKSLAAQNMERLGIADLAERCYRELSGGQQQRVLLARALCATQKLIILDEPIAGLDPDAAADMYQIIESLNQSGITIIMITHDITEAIPYATHVLRIGRNTFWGTREEYLSL